MNSFELFIMIRKDVKPFMAEGYFTFAPVPPPFLSANKLAAMKAERENRLQLILLCAASLLWSAVLLLFSAQLLVVSNTAGLLLLASVTAAIASGGLIAAALLSEPRFSLKQKKEGTLH